MRLTPLRRSGLLGAATVAAVATLAMVTTAFAAPDKPAPTSGDERAVAYDKNVAPGHDDACTVGGLTGTVVDKKKLTFTGGGLQDQYLDITAVDGVTVTGVVVKGSDAFNVYLAAKLGPLPWNKLRSPDNNGGNIPTISHWYACGVDKQTSTTSSSSTTSSASSSSSAPSSTAASSSEVVATTTTAAAAPATDDLASTGFGSAWLVGLGAALLAAGAAVLLVLRRRRV